MKHSLTSLRRPAALAALASALLLAACGGGGGGSSSPDPVAVVPGSGVPVSATLSADGAFEFVRSVLATTSESGEPLTLGDAALGSSETDEARPL